MKVYLAVLALLFAGSEFGAAKDLPVIQVLSNTENDVSVVVSNASGRSMYCFADLGTKHLCFAQRWETNKWVDAVQPGNWCGTGIGLLELKRGQNIQDTIHGHDVLHYRTFAGAQF